MLYLVFLASAASCGKSSREYSESWAPESPSEKLPSPQEHGSFCDREISLYCVELILSLGFAF